MANSWIMALKHWNSMKGGKYVVPKKGSKEYAEVKAVQNSMINGKGLKQLGTGHSKEPKKKPKMDMGYTEGGSLRKALNLAKKDPKEFVDIVNSLTQKGGGMKKQKGGFLPAFIIPFIPSIVSALGTAAGAFATGAAAAGGAELVDEIVGDGHSKKKNVKMSKKKQGDGILDLITQNPEESLEVSKILSGAYMPPPPKIVDGKLQIQKGPVENLISSIFG